MGIEEITRIVVNQCNYYVKAFGELCDYCIENRRKYFASRQRLLTAIDTYENDFLYKIDGATGLAFSLGVENTGEMYSKYLDELRKVAREKNHIIYEVYENDGI